MVETFCDGTSDGPSIYERLGVRTVINARGATTAVGGTLMPAEVTAAIAEAAKAFVVLDELNAKVGERIAAVTGAEAGYVTSGSAAGMALAAAACIAGTDVARIRRLPDSEDMRNEIVIHRSHRIAYDQMFRLAGAKLIEIGLPRGTEPWELTEAISNQTAAVAYIDSPVVGPGALEFAEVIDIAHEHSVPVILDAASTLPPVAHLRRWIEAGADLVVFSGGKGIRGPQDTGLLAGRADLVAAAAANGNPHHGIGRAMKVSKEAMVGLAVALDLFMRRDHDRDFAVHSRQAEIICSGLSERDDLRCDLIRDPEQFPAPVVNLYPLGREWSLRVVSDALQQGTPPIHVSLEPGRLQINTHCLLPGDAEQIVRQLRVILDRTATKPAPSAGSPASLGAEGSG